MLLHPLSTLLRLVRAVRYAPPASLTPTAGPAGSKAVHEQPAGFGHVTGMDRRPAAYPRRASPARWRKHSTLGAKGRWQVTDDGELRYSRVQKQWDWTCPAPTAPALPAGRVIPVIPPGFQLSPVQSRELWSAMALMAAGRSPFKGLFARNRA